jgi:pimeloyl-ACP methyl ester carboxylesterase
MSIEHHHVETNGIRLHVAALGPKDGPLLILLHGFPEYWGAWKAHMPLLAAAGFRVLAPDQRGYNTSDKPPAVRDYHIDTLCADIIGLIDAEDRARATIVGHDWGGAVAWRLAQTEPTRLERVAVLNCCPGEVLKAAWRNPGQLLKSWYRFMFQFPWIPELVLQRQDFAALADKMWGSAQPDTFSDAAIAGLKEAWAQPGAINTMLNWYRAALRCPPKAGGQITVPSLLLWGEQDAFLGTHLIDPTMAMCDDGQLVRFPENTHWINHEAVEQVCEKLIAFGAKKH